eukprot:5251454-Amphidinium_carterae.1
MQFSASGAYKSWRSQLEFIVTTDILITSIGTAMSLPQMLSCRLHLTTARARKLPQTTLENLN